MKQRDEFQISHDAKVLSHKLNQISEDIKSAEKRGEVNERMQKLRDELKPADLHYRPECTEFKCGAHKSWNEGFDACFELVMKDAKELVVCLQVLKHLDHHKIAEEVWRIDAALAKWLERWGS